MFACIFLVQQKHPQMSRMSQIVFDSVQSASSADVLIRLAFSFSPRIEPVRADTVILDVDGLERLFGPPSELASKMIRRAAECGLQAKAE